MYMLMSYTTECDLTANRIVANVIKINSYCTRVGPQPVKTSVLIKREKSRHVQGEHHAKIIAEIEIMFL